METTLSKIFFNDLKLSQEGHKQENISFGYIYKSLFKILEESDELETALSRIYDNYKIYFEDGDWFRLFHKSIRQTDFYGSIIIEKPDSLLTDETEIKRWREIQFKSNKTEEERIEFRKLYRKVTNVERISCNGYIDAILYETICMDNGFLYKTLSRTFKEFENPTEER